MTKSLVKNIIKEFIDFGSSKVVPVSETTAEDTLMSSGNVIFSPNQKLDPQTQSIMKRLLIKHSQAWKDLANT